MPAGEGAMGLQAARHSLIAVQGTRFLVQQSPDTRRNLMHSASLCVCRSLASCPVLCLMVGLCCGGSSSCCRVPSGARPWKARVLLSVKCCVNPGCCLASPHKEGCRRCEGL